MENKYLSLIIDVCIIEIAQHEIFKRKGHLGLGELILHNLK